MALPRPLRLGAIVVVVAGIGLSACGDDETATPTTTIPATTAPAAPTTTVTGNSATTATTVAGRVLDYAFRGGSVTGEGRVSVKLGEQITIRVVSDVAEEVHVHTYDLKADLEPDAPSRITFTADIPGVHEVELEKSGLHLLSLEVQ
jgi:heme/copper-type cytochrome/quinol oxidase subunit 2